MAKAAEELPDIWTQHLSKIKVKMDKAELVRTLTILIGCEPEMVGAVDAQLDDIKKEHAFYKEDYGL